MNSLENTPNSDTGSYLQYRISAAMGDLINATGATPDRLGAAHLHTEGPAEPASGNETAMTDSGLSASKFLRTPCTIFAVLTKSQLERKWQ